MTFKIIRSDITWADTDAIVVAANEFLSLDAGTSRAVAMAAGYDMMSAACRNIGWCDPGKAVVTPSFDLGVTCVIHAVAPIWGDGCDEDILLLESAYDAAFDAALENHCASITLPLLGSGNLRWPADISLDIAVERAKLFLEAHEMQITLVLYDDEAFEAGYLRFPEIISYIESAKAVPDNSARAAAEAFASTAKSSQKEPRRFGLLARIREKLGGLAQERVAKAASFEAEAELETVEECEAAVAFSSDERACVASASESARLDSFAKCTVQQLEPMPMASASFGSAPCDIDDWLATKDAGFSETLLSLIDEQGLEDSYVYKRANMSRQHFSKIRSNPDYRPKKNTALALCVALELDMDATKDLLARAGLAFNPSDTFDLIVQYHIINGIYDIFAINQVLFSFDCKLLG